jgi:RNA polymerase sigma-70 factor (ECF subfamily)
MLAPEPTAHLLLAAGRGDQAALAALYRETAPHLFALATRITRRTSLAEEVVQDLFIAVARKAQSYDPARGTAMAWLATITRNRALDLMERARRTTALDDGLAARLVETGPDAFERLAASEDGQRLRACLDTLPEMQRRAVLMAFFDGATHEEVAARMASPLGTVKSWVRRALLRLRDCLGHG